MPAVGSANCTGIGIACSTNCTDTLVQLAAPTVPFPSALSPTLRLQLTRTSHPPRCAVIRPQWEKVENKTGVVLYTGGAVVALWLANTVVSALNSVPLVSPWHELQLASAASLGMPPGKRCSPNPEERSCCKGIAWLTA